MFHVKRILQSRAIKGIIMLFLMSVVSGCIGARQTIQIPDYILVDNGMEVLGGKTLRAFIFENNVKGVQIEQFLANKFKTSNYFEKEIWVTIENEKFKIIVYDNAEFEKYFNSANYAVINEEAKNENYSQRKFIALSVINSYNEDCLTDQSLFQNITIRYLKNLKDAYYNQ